MAKNSETQKRVALHKSILIFNKAIYTFLLGVQVACCFPKASATELKSVDKVLTHCRVVFGKTFNEENVPTLIRVGKGKKKWAKWHLTFFPDWLNYLGKKKTPQSSRTKGIWLKYSIAHIGFAPVSLPTDRTQEIKKRLPWESILHPRWMAIFFFFFFAVLHSNTSVSIEKWEIFFYEEIKLKTELISFALLLAFLLSYYGFNATSHWSSNIKTP